jgi:hypothetical protein
MAINVGTLTAPAAVLRPTVDISLGSASADEWRAALVGVRVDMALAPAVDRAELYVAPTPDAPTAALDDSGSITLGYEDGDATTVFAGQVIGIDAHARGSTRIILGNGGAALAALRVNQSYEQQSAGDIVSDLAGRASVTPGTVDSGVSFAFYVVDDRQTGYQQVATLAKLSGLLAYVTPEGELNFTAPNQGLAVQEFTFGVDVLSLYVTNTSPLVGAVSMVGEGAAGSQGTDAWAWLVKDPASVTGQSGSGSGERLFSGAALRSSDAAGNAAQGALDAFARSEKVGRLLVPGAAAVVVGSPIGVADVPQSDLNGSGLVLSVQHRLGKDYGFLTQITFSTSGGGGVAALGRLL